MRNINELIGIIEGINFDGVVNEKELQRLQAWVDLNRTLICDSIQADFIHLVDEVLEDHRIDSDKKQRLLETAESYAEEETDEDSKIYELYGIIEGIISDGVVNKLEVHSLKEWMDKYGHFIRRHKQSAELCKTIDRIVANKNITDFQQKELLGILDSKMRQARFETKLQDLCKKISEKRNIGTDLIAIIDDEDAIYDIHKLAEQQLAYAIDQSFGKCSCPEMIVVSLALFALLEYDGNFYDRLRQIYTSVYCESPDQKVEGTIRSILDRYSTSTDSFKRTRKISVALENALVPQYFLPSFFEFIYDIYKYNFDCELPYDVFDEFAFVFDGLRDKLLTGGDDFVSNVGQVKKTYNLISSTKQLITSKDGLEELIKLSAIVLKMVDNFYWNREEKTTNPYLSAGYESWKKKQDTPKRDSKGRRTSHSELRSRWEPKYELKGTDVRLVPPIHKINDSFDFNDVAVVVTNYGEEIYRDDSCDTRCIFGGYQIIPQPITLDKPLGKIVYRLVCKDKVIYDSKEKLYRKFIVFNSSGAEIRNNSDYQGQVFVCYRKNDADLQIVSEDIFYNIGCLTVREGDSLPIGNVAFSFSSMEKPGVYGDTYSDCYVSTDGIRKMLPVFKTIKYASFEAEKGASKFEVLVNDQRYKLSDLNPKTISREAVTKYLFPLTIEDDGIATVSVNQLTAGKKKSLLDVTFVVDKRLRYEAEKITDDSYGLLFESGLISKRRYYKISASAFQHDFIRFFYANRPYIYYVPFNVGFYSLDDGKMMSINEELWIDDIELDSELKIYDSECDAMLVQDDNGTCLERDVRVKDKGFYKSVSVGFIRSYKERYKHVNLVFYSQSKIKYEIVVYNRCEFEPKRTEFLVHDAKKTIVVVPFFHGKNTVYFEIVDSTDRSVGKSPALKRGDKAPVSGLKPFERYTFNFYEKANGLLRHKDNLLYSVQKTFYSPRDFVGHAFRISAVIVERFYGKKCIQKEHEFDSWFVKITGRNDAGYVGEIYAKTKNRIRQLSNVNPVELEICGEIVKDTMYAYITSKGDGLLFDSISNGILNTMEDPKATDIYLYELDLRG